MPDTSLEQKSSAPASEPLVESRRTTSSNHIANATAWRAVCISPDYCKVGNTIVGFDSFAYLTEFVTASPNVTALGRPVYRVGDMTRGVQSDAGSHVISGTSMGSGYVKFLDGQEHVRVNGIPVVRNGSKCLINCDAAGAGGAIGRVMTEKKSTSPTDSADRPIATRALSESKRVLADKWQGFKDTATLLWQAIPGTSDAAMGEAARQKLVGGVASALDGLGTLIGPSPEMVQAAYSSGDASAIATIEQLQANQVQAVDAIIDATKTAWSEAEKRNGVAGASAMVLTTLGTEIVGGKGTGALLRVSKRIAEIVKLARTPLEAAARLHDELAAARKAGLTTQEIHLLEKALEERLAQSAKVAKAAEESGGGVHVKGAQASKQTKPSTAGGWRNAPNIDEWLKNGGEVLEDAGGGLTYIRKDGVSIVYDKNGFPNMSKYSRIEVELKNVSGNNDVDFKEANRLAGLPSGRRPPLGETWHHVPNSNKMQLVPREIHADFTHIGSASQARILNQKGVP
jgi:uncharacterized Zn-binding protein involved in type VI secretion